MVYDDDEMGDENTTQIRISLQLYPGCDESLSVPTEPIAVPANLKRKGLSSVINHLLGREETDTDDDDDSSNDETPRESLNNAIQFDFLLKKTSRLLRTSIENAVRSSGLSTEEAIVILYFPAVEPPQVSEDSEELPDWVSALSLGKEDESLLVSGSYDGSIRLHYDGEVVAQSVAHGHDGIGAPIKCMDMQSLNSKPGLRMIATGSIDHSVSTHLCNYSNDANDNYSASISLHASYAGSHTNSIEALCFSDDCKNLVSGDFDGNIALWKVPFEVNNGSSTQVLKKSKLQKKDFHDEKVATKTEVSAEATWKAHTSNISGIAWAIDRKYLITGSYDHSVKTWDAERQDCLLTLNGSRVVTSLGRCSNSDVIATGHPDCAIRLWDMRVGDKEQSKVSDSSLKAR